MTKILSCIISELMHKFICLRSVLTWLRLADTTFKHFKGHWRARDRDRQTARQTDRDRERVCVRACVCERDRQTDSDRDRQRQRDRNRETEFHRKRETCIV